MPSPAEIVRALAERTAFAAPPRGTGRYRYLRTSGWARHTARTTDGRVLSASTRFFAREDWIAADGSGRLLVTQGEAVVRPSGYFPPGGLLGDFVDASDLASATAALRRRVSPSRAGKAFSSVWLTQVVPPDLQRLLLRWLAEHPGLVVEDADLPGVVVSVPDAAWLRRRLLVFDSRTGMLLETRDVEEGGATVSGCTRWLEAGYTDSTESRPAEAS
ncbi:hypothetical protein CU254_24800 [Amycolatopsis sp. AA4]|uniref:hypothetical protein n=1 Tax=Actinomycetes TaxID=1760 RepID=UPI0001B57B00|nr:MULTISPECIES: hypothetical protein [Actinomycetes]ATY13297.1 hypothetical protein CU254_24800 [Amycolatopsis sp. AA4]EFL09215.1 predicted protein [Streptomyces sp. AA4]